MQRPTQSAFDGDRGVACMLHACHTYFVCRLPAWCTHVGMFRSLRATFLPLEMASLMMLAIVWLFPGPRHRRLILNSFNNIILRSSIIVSWCYRLLCLHACLPTCLPTCLHICLLTCLHTCLHICLLTCLPTCLPTCLHTCLHTHLPTCLQTCLRTCLPTSLHTCPHTCVHTPVPGGPIITNDSPVAAACIARSCADMCAAMWVGIWLKQIEALRPCATQLLACG